MNLGDLSDKMLEEMLEKTVLSREKLLNENIRLKNELWHLENKASHYFVCTVFLAVVLVVMFCFYGYFIFSTIW